MMTALVLVLAQALVVDGTRYQVNEEGRLQATRIADEKVLYTWWPDPPALPLTGRMAFQQGVLAAGLGTGVGLYALDVSRPERTTAAPLRVFVDQRIAGNIGAAPVLANVGPDQQRFILSTAGQDAPRPGLLMLPLHGDRHYLLEVHSPGASLGAVAVARRADGRALYAYAGDSMGRLWRFDLTGEVPWSQPKQRKPLFTATRPDGTRQPISVAPAVMIGPGEGYLLAFGTSAGNGNTLYTFHDRLGKPSNAGRDDLVKRKARPEQDGLRIEGRRFDYGESPGWYLDLVCGAGERMTGLDAKGGLLIASTTLVDGAGGCTYALLPLSGLPPDDALTARRTDGALEDDGELIAIGPEVVVERNRATVRRAQDFQLARRETDGTLHILQQVRTTRRYGRLGWRELPHWRVLHEQARREP